MLRALVIVSSLAVATSCAAKLSSQGAGAGGTDDTGGAGGAAGAPSDPTNDAGAGGTVASDAGTPPKCGSPSVDLCGVPIALCGYQWGSAANVGADCVIVLPPVVQVDPFAAPTFEVVLDCNFDTHWFVDIDDPSASAVTVTLPPDLCELAQSDPNASLLFIESCYLIC